MKKTAGFLLIVTGIVLIIISIMALVQAFDVFTASGTSTESVGHVLGSIIFPLLLTVFGRWVLRKGRGMVKNGKDKKGDGKDTEDGKGNVKNENNASPGSI